MLANPRRMLGASRWAITLVALLILAGCATQGPVPETVETLPATDGVGADSAVAWHYLRFRFARPSSDETDSYLDLLVANELVAPLLVAAQDDLLMWRFHRRWPDDPTGHQFSWIVLATPQVVARLDAQIRAAPLLDALESDGYLREYRVDVARSNAPGDLAATSDPAWPETLQREWPHFIMGASRMWLGLVQAEVSGVDDKDLHERYRSVDAAIDALWFAEGNHALFHHLSALFGYKPLQVLRRDIMTF